MVKQKPVLLCPKSNRVDDATLVLRDDLVTISTWDRDTPLSSMQIWLIGKNPHDPALPLTNAQRLSDTRDKYILSYMIDFLNVITRLKVNKDKHMREMGQYLEQNTYKEQITLPHDSYQRLIKEHPQLAKMPYLYPNNESSKKLVEDLNADV